MNMSPGDPVLAVAVRAARRAAAVIVDAARDLKRLPSHAKEHGDIATDTDTEAENAIIATLRAAFPDHAILGEESGEIVGRIADAGDGRGAKPSFRWIIDPIDGTANFIHGYPYYAVSIALTHGTEITHAVILDPVHDDLFTAIRGKGAQLNGSPLRTSTCLDLEDALVGTVFPTRES
ncbi:MAG: inositol monophosphatase family protein, partial [Betaproteobacteria bacterium]